MPSSRPEDDWEPEWLYVADLSPDAIVSMCGRWVDSFLEASQSPLAEYRERTCRRLTEDTEQLVILAENKGIDSSSLIRIRDALSEQFLVVEVDRGVLPAVNRETVNEALVVLDRLSAPYKLAISRRILASHPVQRGPTPTTKDEDMATSQGAASHIAALQTVLSELDRWNRDPGSVTGYVIESIDPGHPLHTAVDTLQKVAYGGKGLPRPAIGHWRKLLRLSRSGDEALTDEAEEQADLLADWIGQEIARLSPVKGNRATGAAGSTPKKSQSTKTPKRGRPVDPMTIQRADFARPLREQGKTWDEIAAAYLKKYPKDLEASADTIRLAYTPKRGRKNLPK